MFTIAAYTIAHTLHESANTLISRAVRIDNARAITLKHLRAEYPDQHQVCQFNRKHAFTHNLDVPAIRHVIQ